MRTKSEVTKMNNLSILNCFLIFSLLSSLGLCRPSNDDILDDEAFKDDYQSEDNDDKEDLEKSEDVDEDYKQGVMPVMKSTDHEFIVKEGDQVVLPCDHENGDNYVTIWRNGSNIIYQEKQRMTSDVLRVSVPPEKQNHSLIIKNVSKSDSGLYTCLLLIDAKKSLRVTHTLQVQEPAKIDYFEPAESEKIIEKGKSLSLVCHASGFPKPSVHWTRKMKDSKHIDHLEGSNYTIPSVGREHSGYYECTARNFDHPEKRGVEVLVHFAPEVSIKSDIVTTAEGKESEMHCTVYAEPAASLVWLKDNYPLTSNEHIRLFQDPNKAHKHVLKIENTKAEDFGTYHCIANNTLGMTRKTFVLNDNEMSNEINQGPLEPNPNTGSQLRISLALVSSILVARFFC